MNLIGIKKNLDLLNKLKIIITCRSTEISDSEIDEVFKIEEKYYLTNSRYICDINSKDIFNYVKNLISYIKRYNDSKLFGQFKLLKTAKEYMEFLEKNTNLQ